jgi:hypothetical protein
MGKAMKIALSKAVVAASLLAVGGFTPAEADPDNDRNRKVEIVSTSLSDPSVTKITGLKDSVFRETLRLQIKS